MDVGAAACAIRIPSGCASARVALAEGLCKRRVCLRTLDWQRTDLRTQYLERFLHLEQNYSPNDERREGVRRKRSGRSVPTVWMMGGGPRTYPGGVRKWQWKRRQRKDVWELEKQRLSRERKLFEIRRREELRKASPSGSFTLERPAENSDMTGEIMTTVAGRSRAGGLLDPGGLHGEEEAEPRDVMDWDGELETTAVEGKRNSESGQKAWTGSKRDVVKQIQKVQNRVMEKYTRQWGASDHENASSFAQLPVSRLTLKALNLIVGTQNVAQQEDIIQLLLKGQDLLARTKNPAEDSISSLIYAIELVLSERQQLPRSEIARLQQKLTVSGRSPITALLVCPTQDRASFLASDARQLLSFHPNIKVQMVKGGNDVKEEIQRLRKLPCEIVIATPGRLLSHLQRSPEFRGQLNGLKLLALHEVPKLFDMGYRKTLERISQLLPRSRQTLLWSSTMSDEILAFSLNVFRKQYEVFNRGGSDADKVAYETAKQEFITVPIELHLALICSFLKSHVAQEPNFKVVVFCQTVRTTTFMAELFRNMGYYTLEVHMRKNERQRERVAAEFRTTRGGVILFTCGSSVWGVANPDVSLVLQVGPPSGREQYIQRVTLSGQETSKRQCILLLMAHQLDFLQELGPIPLREANLPETTSDTVAQVQQGVYQVNYLVRVKAYLAWLRYHIARTSSDIGKEKVLRLSVMYSTALGFQVPPQLNLRTRRALGLTENPPQNGSSLVGSK